MPIIPGVFIETSQGVAHSLVRPWLLWSDAWNSFLAKRAAEKDTNLASTAVSAGGGEW